MVRKLVSYINIHLAIQLSLSVSIQSLCGTSFHSFEQGASSLGFAHADMASLAEDATTNWYNPAGITRFDCTEFSIGSANVHFDTYVNSFLAFDSTLGSDVLTVFDIYNPLIELITIITVPTPYTQIIPRSKGDTNQVYGYGHLIQPVLKNYGPFDVSVGLSLTSPWNWNTDYSCTNLVSYARRTQIDSFAIAPTFAIRAFKSLSLGFQPKWERFSWYQSSEFSRLLGVNYSLRNWFCGYNLSALWQINPCLRVGTTFDFNKSHTLRGNGNLLTENFSAKAKIHLPNILTVGGTWEVSPLIALTGTFVFSNWSKFKTVKYQIKQANGIDAVSAIIPYNFKDSYLSALGLRYLANSHFTLRAGISYETPATRNAYREIKFHDARKYGIGIGCNYAFNCHVSADFGYMFTYSPTTQLRSNPFTDYNPYVLTVLTDNTSLSLDSPSTDVSPAITQNAAQFFGSVKTLISTFGLQLNGRF